MATMRTAAEHIEEADSILEAVNYTPANEYYSREARTADILQAQAHATLALAILAARDA